MELSNRRAEPHGASVSLGPLPHTSQTCFFNSITAPRTALNQFFSFGSLSLSSTAATACPCVHFYMSLQGFYPGFIYFFFFSL